MYLSPRLLGAHTVNRLTAASRAVLVTLGDDTFTKSDLAEIKCFNFFAAQALNRVVNEELKVKNTRDLYERFGPDALVLPRIGAIGIAVLGACFQIKRVGGSHPLESWARNHRTDEQRDYVTFDTMKTRQHLQTTKTVRRSRTTRKHLRVVRRAS